MSLLIFNMSGVALSWASLTHREEVRLLLQCCSPPQKCECDPRECTRTQKHTWAKTSEVRGRGEEATVSLLPSHSLSHFNISSMRNGKENWSQEAKKNLILDQHLRKNWISPSCTSA